MSKCILIFVFALICRGRIIAQSYGLLFNSHEVVQEKRTSLDLSPGDSLCFSKNFDLDFDFRFIPGNNIYFGYVFRIISGGDRNIDLIYDQKTKFFQLITGENFSGPGFSIDSTRLYDDWNRLSLKFDLQKNILSLLVNGNVVVQSRSFQLGNCFKFLWGANDFNKFKTRDIPPMEVKDIRLFEQGSIKYFWPLDELEGNTGTDREKKMKAAVTNPVWIKPGHQQWRKATTFTLNGFAGVTFDDKNGKLFIAGSDSLAVYNTDNKEQALSFTPNPHHEFILGHQLVFDTMQNGLFDLFIDEKKIYPYDSSSRSWMPQAFHFVTEYWHANKFISSKDSAVYIIGGYGQLTYKNIVQRYSLATRQWDTLKISGDFFSPRYLAALGTDPSGNYAYIIGGYGSHSGNQMLDPSVNYDLFRFDVKARAFTKLYSLHPSGGQFTFANSLIIPRDSKNFYALIFPNDRFKSELQLIKGSLEDSSYLPVGTALPYNFHDIRSFADLYYSKAKNRLIAVTLLYTREEEKEKRSEINIYTLDFPPEPANSTPFFTSHNNSAIYWFTGALILLIAAGLYFVMRRKKKETETGKLIVEKENAEIIFPGHTAVIQNRHSAVYLFGQFQVIDKDGNDITRLFTPLLKELFLIMVIYSYRKGRGISSETLTEILWHDKSPKDAINNRSVNITKLKTILDKIGICSIGKESGYWQFGTQDDNLYIDYRRFSQLEASPAGNHDFIKELSSIIRRGPLLLQTEYGWLDNIKAEISNSVIQLCLNNLKNHDISHHPEAALEIANYIFYFDPLNEEALTSKCKSLIQLKRHSLAKTTYDNFVREYKKSYGQDFHETFNEVIA